MLDWLRRKLTCVSSHEERIHGGITENNINRFKVMTDPSLASECNIDVRSGILEVNDDELVHYQGGGEPIRWSYRCLRRYGHGNDTFLFESGRRCSTGPGLFAFKCRRADVLHNVFAEKLRRYAANRNGPSVDTLRRQSEFSSLQSPNRYSDGVGLTAHAPHPHIIDAPYLSPVPSAKAAYANGEMIASVSSQNGVSYVNCAGAGEGLPANNYINTPGGLFNGVQPTANGVAKTNGIHPDEDARQLNYAELDLATNDEVSTNKTPTKSKTQSNSTNGGIQYVNVNVSSDEDDEAFLPANAAPTPQYVNVVKNKPANSTSSHTTTSAPYTNGYTSNLPQSAGRLPLQSLAPTPEDSVSTQYTTIDFQKTAAIASTAKSTQSDSSQEGVRKTRHDSSADDLH